MKYLENYKFPQDTYKELSTTIKTSSPLIDRAITQTKNVLSCGARMAKYQLGAVIHGPTAKEVVKDVDLSEKTCLITGANSGIGLEMTRCLIARGANVLMACRNKYAADQVSRSILSAEGALEGEVPRLRVYSLNLASLRSVTECCEQILKQEKKIDILILNAAVFGLPWTLTEDLLETTFQVNYLSQWYLLMKIEPILASDARVVFVSSESHRNVKWSIDDQGLPTESLLSLPPDVYTSIKAYNTSKLCGVLAMHCIGYQWLKTSRSVFCAHPGSFVKTRLCQNWWPYEALYTAMVPFSKTIAHAASTPLYCATSPDLDGLSGYYYKDLKRCDESELASDFHLAFRINDLSKEILMERMQAWAPKKEEETEKRPAMEQKATLHDNLTPEFSA